MDAFVTEPDGREAPVRAQWEHNDAENAQPPLWTAMYPEINTALEQHYVVGSNWFAEEVPLNKKKKGNENHVAARRMYNIEAMTQQRQHYDIVTQGWVTVSRLVEIRRIYVCGDPKDIYIYTSPTGLFGPRKIWKRLSLAIDDFEVYMQNATAVCIYTTKWSTHAITIFFLCPNPVVVYIYIYILYLGPPICTLAPRHCQ